MGSQRTGPSRDPPAVLRVELLHESERTRVSRLVFPARTVIRKEPLGSGAQRRLHHEVEILEGLSGIKGIVGLAAGAQPCPGSILLVDVGGTALSEWRTPCCPGELLDLAVSLARTVAEMHRRGVMHRDISPANILVGEDRRTAFLADFAVATTFVEVQPEFVHPSEVVGTIPYLAPEQTGRTGRPVDQRADLYALGATLYELATGAPPFGAGDPLKVIHDHLARVPVAPSVLNPAVPTGLSAIITHLLAKEPDDRYQSADGLLSDLAVVRRGGVVTHPGDHDLPSRALAPSRLSGRDEEIGELGAVFVEAMAGQRRGILVSGAPGVGKTWLVNELRPIVASSDGWFVAGKFDQYRRDQEYDGVRQALRALSRLLLAEPEDDLAEVRDQMLGALGANSGLLAAVAPEMATLLKVPPEPGDPLTAQVRTQHAAAAVLRAVACRKRPVVFFVDDLQWAGRTPLGVLDLIFDGEEQVEGLLLVGAYRESEVDAAHPLTPMLARWHRRPTGPRHLRLGNLAPAGQAAMMADLLRLPPRLATELARLIAPSTGGNPYDTVELLTMLRHEDALTVRDGRWRWDRDTLRARLDRVDMSDLLAARVAQVPPDTTDVLTTMACLAGRVELDVLAAAAGLAENEVERRLAPAFADGLLVLESDGRATIRFHHDRAQESVLRRVSSQEQRDVRLRVARRLASRPAFFAVAAQQYLSVVDAVHVPAERRLMVRLFRRAADEAKLLSNYPLVERFLAAAVTLIDPVDTDQLIAVHIDWHAALYSLGRLDEGDEVYQTISELCTHASQRAAATVVQLRSLTNRGCAGEAMRLGLRELRQLGLAVPDRDHLEADIARRLDMLYRWIDQTSDSDDLGRPDITDRSRLGAIKVVDGLMPAAYFADRAMMAWLTATALQLWARYGPDPTLAGPAGLATFVTIARGHDYRTGYRILRRILAVCQARGYGAALHRVRYLYLLSTGHWFDPLEENVSAAYRTLEDLIEAGDLQYACWTHALLGWNLLDCAPSLDAFAAEVDEAMAFATRTGNLYTEESFRMWRQLVRVLRGAACYSAADEAAQVSSLTANQAAIANLHLTRALAAAILDHPADLVRHAEALMPWLPSIEATYQVAQARLLRALALAEQVRTADLAQRDAHLAELDESIEWLAARTADAPANFLHLLRLAEAERAWATGAFHEAIHTFDLAQREAATRARPWHRALILERAARFYLAHGIQETGHLLLAAARDHYLAWGATAKVSQLDWARPAVHAEPTDTQPASPLPEQPAAYRATVTTGTLDLGGIVTASQALSSETGIEGLRRRLVDTLSTMTGATTVHLLLHDPHDHSWSLPSSNGATISLRQASHHRLVPSSVIRYAERTREPLNSPDATRDDRFRADPYFLDQDRCSLLAVPITIRGDLRAMLLLENQMIRNAFTTERLEAVTLVAGQLAVSLDNVLVYTSLERKVAERTRQLAAANQRLEQLSTIDPLTGLANRRRLDEILDTAWHQARGQATPLALAMIDIDHFKPYNDHYGHTSGDHCLQHVATCLADNIRPTDTATRYGGEEFLIVMPHTNLDTATTLTQNLRAAVTNLAEPHPLDTYVTISIGVAATTPTLTTSQATLIDLADSQLYQAKNHGRNRVEAAQLPSTPQ
ncbi:diguanylate cyclase [Pseudofrankia sp. BMG5.36]|uniref:diguanylate cyclase domain-containing protein n=1 Tax=Pseudofrankia sp. BMG5.36 TaxID=1834512 RepID=UPI0008D94BB6|nr:diguanylate cyclase [Pseudofrankia sp. BMG5.36]OHV43467.1 serine/threonine protein kinase [Pseudofrankia sp. BMG5.36]